MKQTLRFLFIVLCLVFQSQLFANTVIVKGTVKDSANNPVANKTVVIYTTDSLHGCLISHTVTTNPNGFYTDTLKCTAADITKLFVSVENCNGTRLQRDPAVTNTNIVEVNFVICVALTTPPTNCKAAFSFTSTATGVKFNSAGSSAPAGDSIISRRWIFGDSSAAGDGVDPTHAYTKPGVYNVCLTIKTKKGCESNFCQTVTFTPASNDCKIESSVSVERVSARQFRFNNSQTTILAGDSIFQRIWKFSDGTSLDGNQVNPLREFKDTGVHYACVTIKTMKGCEKQFCVTFTIRDSVPGTVPPTACKSVFSINTTGLTVKFNSANSSAPVGDSIISRTWLFGDSSAKLDGNRIDPSHTYAKAGTYNACLTIKTKNGCESNTCISFILRDTVVVKPPTNCKANFTYTIKDSTVFFNSSTSVGTSPTDSIISRTWYYADSVNYVSLTGNVIAPSYKYVIPGSYNVYLAIKTKSGCESKFNAIVVIPPPPPPVPTTGCSATFAFVMQNGTVKFNSAASKGVNDRDTIISRTWLFGDSTAPVQGSIDPTHVYAKSGKYTVMLYIKTKAGCESKYSVTIEVNVVPPTPPTNCNVDVQLTAERIALKKVQFNSSLSKTQAGDSIIQRTWKFGDNSSLLTGNEIKPVKEFATAGIYTVCLEEKTTKGCVAQTCKQVMVQDTVTTPQASVDYIKIISINPNPVISQMVTTVFSRNTNVEAEISVYDIYGVRKMTVKKLLGQGNNMIELNVGSLFHGPYFLRVSSKSGNDSKAFYKL